MFEISSNDNSKRGQEAIKNDFYSWTEKTRYLTQQRLSDNVIRVLQFPEVSPSGAIDYIKEFDYTHNLVTNDGEIFYAKMGANETPSSLEDFSTGYFDMGTTAYSEAETDTYNEYDVSGTSSISGSIQLFTSGYPKTNDTGDGDNTGDATDAVSYAVNYTAAAWNDTDIEQGAIHENPTPTTATKILCAFSFTSFAKTSSDTLKVFVNHLGTLAEHLTINITNFFTQASILLCPLPIYSQAKLHNSRLVRRVR